MPGPGAGHFFALRSQTFSLSSDRVADHLKQEVEYITGVDMSCLMHLEGILKRQKSKVKVIHIAEILNTQE